MFDETRCDRCGDCLVSCLYVDYDKERAAFEIDEFIAGRAARILSTCLTCFACNEYCPTDARPFDLILERQEHFGSLGVAPETIAAEEGRYAVTSEVRVPENQGRVLSACVFSSSDAELFQGRLFDGFADGEGTPLILLHPIRRSGFGFGASASARTDHCHRLANQLEELPADRQQMLRLLRGKRCYFISAEGCRSG